MRICLKITSNQFWTILTIGFFSISLGGCARDSSKNARVTGALSSLLPATLAVPSPPPAVAINAGTIIDSSNEGGVDDSSVHKTASGSVNLSEVSAGGSYQRDLAVSTHFKVRGGISAR